jgi:hypothetical protein
MSSTRNPNDPKLRKIISEGPLKGQQESYLVLSEEERARGFVRPVRLRYKHIACGHVTGMSQDIAETYARNPKFYGGTFCVHCRSHFRLVDQNGNRTFLWVPDGTPVGT